MKKIKKRIKKHKKNNIPIIIILGVVLLAILIFIFINYYSPKYSFYFNNKKINTSITIYYKSKFKYPKYKVIYQNKDISKNVKIIGRVNTKKVGVYKLKYVVNYGIFNTSRVVTVKVKDKIAPTIELIGASTIYICPNGKYHEPGFIAIDNLDGNITKKVIASKDKNIITYTVTDSSDNTTIKKRTIKYFDNNFPVITLNGVENKTIIVGDKYKELGATAIDKCDGNISDNIKISGSVDYNKAGNYVIEYEVSDKALNKTIKTRTITVIEKGGKGTIYLTFDDGPKEATTDVILDILKEEKIKATFFVTNYGPDNLIKREYDEGHAIGIHTATHRYDYLYASVDNFYQDFNSVKERIKNITGNDTKIFRFPGGSSNTISRRYSRGIMSLLTNQMLQNGYKYYDWNVASGDSGLYNTKEEVINHVISKLSKDKVNMILMHDVKTHTRDALKEIIKYGKENGYVFDKITYDTPMIAQQVNN